MSKQLKVTNPIVLSQAQFDARRNAGTLAAGEYIIKGSGIYKHSGSFSYSNYYYNFYFLSTDATALTTVSQLINKNLMLMNIQAEADNCYVTCATGAGSSTMISMLRLNGDGEEGDYTFRTVYPSNSLSVTDTVTEF